MKIWTYKEMKDKVLLDLDLQDEIFISPDEMVGYFNEAMNEAESEIMVLNQDYFLSKYYLPEVAGQNEFDLPRNIYANKIRQIIYKNGSIQYAISQFRRKQKFEEIALTEQYGVNDDYRYLLVNKFAGQAKLVMHPVARESAILAPYASRFTPIIMWYIRNCARIPITGEYCNPEIIATTQVNTGTNEITVYSGTLQEPGIEAESKPGPYPGSTKFITGEKIRFRKGPGGSLPSGLTEGVEYFAIASGFSPGVASYTLKVASTRALALAGTALALGSVGSVFFVVEPVATTARIEATLIDIPEFSTFVMQWVKCRCMEKEGDPRLQGAAEILVQQKKQMVDTLVVGIDDDDDTIQADFSHYREST